MQPILLTSLVFAIPALVALGVLVVRTRRQLNQLQMENNAFMDTATDGVIYADGNGVIETANRAAERMFGYSSDELTGRSLKDLIDLEKAEAFTRFTHGVAHSNPHVEDTMELTGVRKDGSTLPINMALSSVKEGKNLRTIAMVRDHSDATQLKALLDIDPLTQIYNHRAIDEIMVRELERSRRYDSALTMLMINIDLFDKLNQADGKLKGDELLRLTAQSLKHWSRATDYVGRWGSDEFVVVCPELSEEDAFVCAERLRRNFQKLGADLGTNLTFSIGVSSVEDDFAEVSLDSMIASAGRALYVAKSRGLNRIERISYQ